MTFTYTYTAREQDNPNHVATFTIYDDILKINLMGLISQVSDIVVDDDPQEAAKKVLTTQAGTFIYKLLELLSGPIHIKDVIPSLEDGALKLVLWKRLAGFRIAPAVVMMGRVDNPQGAVQFIETLNVQQNKAESKPGYFSGPLDYAATWIALLIGAIILVKLPCKNKRRRK